VIGSELYKPLGREIMIRDIIVQNFSLFFFQRGKTVVRRLSQREAAHA
jgi:hypothetical protein